MSDIMLNLCSADGSSQGTRPAGNKKRKNQLFQRKMQHLAAKGYLKDKQNHPRYKRHDQTPCQNGEPTTSSFTVTHNKSLPHLASAASTSFSSPSTSAHILPSVTITVNSKGSHEMPKEPVDTKTAPGPKPSISGFHKPTTSSAGNPTKYLAIDCEMVGSGPKGSINQLARCSIVSYEGDVVFDKFIKPSMPVTDYRTRWSGIRPRDLIKAMPYSEARKEILKLLIGKVVIGHAIHNDFKALHYTHPSVMTRDTSRIPLLNLKAGFAENECASLKRLTKAIFNRDIQTGKKGHSSVEDAKATMELYKVVEEQWERTLVTKSMAS
ncbi:interferon-stimulated 20 kDa exonuclease-like 2 [Melanotaenia boesemani]|uniref:interferon-stimulated 20 kDa exonuclease-like 2 n=1 Tax=Melanotaenia boesemani TaxID=1250792 RepID=UPI001C05A361|nr:interferon-stimulated 20 kDa exonuclease-like 2 [Melanotaenia boesemani]XP_041842723.1 interferon-stimulated 20 kDa exonuclease-like 2 [Melanotaenia boesemani]XP_041842724.1 interferon-stimulated 20 kDa exonuclease-like 2 [Melanotaenia boesemani]